MDIEPEKFELEPEKITFLDIIIFAITGLLLWVGIYLLLRVVDFPL